MKFFPLIAVAFIFMSFTGWQTNMEKAKAEAQQNHKYILLNFSGSDWCGPCIRLHREFFVNDSFKQLADSNLVLVNADFPRQKKNQLEKTLQQENELLADKYNPNGAFPYTLLLDENGKVVKTWDGLPKVNPQEFVNEIAHVLHADN